MMQTVRQDIAPDVHRALRVSSQPVEEATLSPGTAGIKASHPARPLRLWWRAALVLPTLLAILYYGAVASDRYVSEAKFVVRTAARPVAAGALGTFLQMSGLARANDDAFAVESFITSRDAVSMLLESIPLRKIYGRDEADFISRYPSVFYGSSIEELHRYLGWMVRSAHSSASGITSLRVEAFRPEDAKAVAARLLELGELTVNRMNARIHEDAIRTSLGAVKDLESRLVAAQIAITRFRTEELMIDPGSSSIIVTEVISRLHAERAEAEAQLREITSAAPSSPALVAVTRRIEALDAAIASERLKISDRSEGLAGKLAQFERLVLEREFVKSELELARKGLDQARAEARRQQLYIEHVVRPSLPDYPMSPARLHGIWTVFSLNMVALLLGWLFYSGVREHSAGR